MKCKFCNNIIEDNFVFCPFCGSQIVRKSSGGIKIPAPQKRGSRWRIRLQAEGVSATFDTKEEAETWAKAIRADFLKAEKNAPPKFKLFGEALDDYILLNENVFSPATIREYKRSRNRELLPLVDKDVYSLTNHDMQKFVNDYSKGHAPKTVIDVYNRAMKVIRSVDESISFKVNLPSRSKANVAVPSAEDIKQIYSAIKGTKLELPFLLAVTGSLRRGEICALTQADVAENGVYVRRDMVKSDKEWVIKGKPKTADSVRLALLPPFVMNIIKEVKTDRLVPMTPNTLTGNFSRFLHRHNLPQYSFHSLRHYWASVAHTIMPDSYVLANGGWSTMSTPRKVYIKTMDEENAKLQAKMNSAFSAILDQVADQ